MVKLFTRVVLAVFALAVVATGILYYMGVRDDTSTGTAQAIADPAQRVAYGQYLARIGDCMTCHTARGGAPYAGGAAIPTPFGTFYGPNITPDPATGIGTWSADDFWQALHNGKAPHGRLLYPAFPYTEYTKVSRADADALYAYLKTVPPVRQPSRPHALDFPYDQRFLLAFWRGLYFRPGVEADAAGQDPGFAAAGTPSQGPASTPGVLPRPASDPTASSRPSSGAVVPPVQSSLAADAAQRLRGRYLVDGLGHCIACHAPRNSLGATAADGLTGGEIAGLGWYAPPLNGDPTAGLGRWSAADIVALLQTGTAAGGVASGPMAEVVTGGSQYLTNADATAIAAYLKSLPTAAPAVAAVAPAGDTLERGSKLYTQHCAQCHQDTGQGSGQAWPPLAGNISVTAPTPRNAIRMVLEGGFAPPTAANPQPHGMPPFGQFLGDEDVAAVVTYIRNSWGNAAGRVTAFDVKRTRAEALAE